ncbi:MAG: hypothetical protein VX899_04615 [Myxococcota bacterium]|nr:hypothetical protein [Myxococcota bacterium]
MSWRSGLVVGFGGLVLACAAPDTEMSLRTKRSEAPFELKQIAEQQAAIHAAESAYLGCSNEQEATGMLASVDPKAQRSWPQTPCWQRLNPEAGQVRGVYWVDVPGDGQRYLAGALIDVDGDGVYARYELTDGGEPERLTPTDVY